MFAIVLILMLSSNSESQNLVDDIWTYDNQNEWNLHFKACNGSHESPIDINKSKVKIDSNLRIKFHNYAQTFHESTAQNNGHTVRVFLHLNSKNEIPYVSGIGLDHKRFVLDSFHFHWGENDFNGSEHSIDNVKRSAELHLVHWNSDYRDLSDAMDRNDGLLVITVFIETKIITDFGVIQVKDDNRALSPIIDVLPDIKHFGQSVRIGVALDLGALLPEDTQLFYKYEGSLTTPPCSPIATFIIFVAPIHISDRQVLTAALIDHSLNIDLLEQLSQFRQLRGATIGGKSVRLFHTSRQQMPVNDRVVFVSDPLSDSNSRFN